MATSEPRGPRTVADFCFFGFTVAAWVLLHVFPSAWFPPPRNGRYTEEQLYKAFFVCLPAGVAGYCLARFVAWRRGESRKAQRRNGGGPMWTARSEQLPGRRGLKFAIDLGSSPVSSAEALRRWQQDAEFRAWYNGLLAEAPFAAFRWETPPLTAATADRPFEFVLLNSPGLAREPDAVAFAKHFQGAGAETVVAFANLGGDAVLVVPCPAGPVTVYGHLAAFVRQAPEAQRHALWQAVGAALQRRLGARPVWLSTAGAGVSWLHVRLDERPKYYGHAPYRDAT